MSVELRPATALCFAVIAFLSVSNGAAGQAAKRDAIGDWLKTTGGSAAIPADAAKQEAAKAAVADPRDGDPQYEQAKALMVAIDAILRDAADTRAGASKLPSRDDYIIPPFWKETREDRNAKVRDLLDAALGIVANAPIVEVQKEGRGASPQYPRTRRPKRQAQGKAARSAEGRNPSRYPDGHDCLDRSGDRREQQKDRSQSRQDQS